MSPSGSHLTETNSAAKFMNSSNPVVAAFIESASEAIGKMAMFTLEVEAIDAVEAPLGSFELVAAMSLSQQADRLVVMGLERQLAQYLVAGMIGVDPDEANEFLEDGIGELLNVIAGSAKTRLKDTESSFELTLPKVAVDSKSPIDEPGGTPGITISGRVGTEPLAMTIWIQGVDVGT